MAGIHRPERIPVAEISDAALVALAGKGNDDAYRALYRAYVKPVYWIAHRLIGNISDAEDLTQETFVVAWRKLPELELMGQSLLPWLATVCRMQAANRIRQQRAERTRTASVDLDRDHPSPANVEQQVIDSDTVDRILAEVATLSEVDREIFRLCITDGFAYHAAAEQLGVTHSVVRNRLSRIRTRLRTVAKESE